MDVREISVEKLNPAQYNPRVNLKPGDTEYEKLKNSIEAFGYVDPIVWNERTGNVIGGHQRLKILTDQGAEKVAVSVVNLSEPEEMALNLALNKIKGDWDDEKLAVLLEELRANDEIDEMLSGFDETEIDGILSAIDDDALDGFFDDAPEAEDSEDTSEKAPRMTVCPYCGREHEV